MSFKTGDFVVIEKKVDDNRWLWLPDMDTFIGTVGQVVDSNDGIEETAPVYPRSSTYYLVETVSDNEYKKYQYPALAHLYRPQWVYRVEALRLATPDEIRGHSLIMNLKAATDPQYRSSQKT